MGYIPLLMEARKQAAGERGRRNAVPVMAPHGRDRIGST